MKRLKILLLFFPFCALALKASAQFRAYSNEFMNIGAGARGLGMGGAQVSSATDATAGYWNPAGLGFVREIPTFSAMHAAYFSGIGKYDFLAAAIPLNDNKRTLGISAIRFGVDDIPNTLFLVDPQTGQLNYNNISAFSSADYGFLLSYGQLLKDEPDMQISIGGNVKVLYRHVGSFANALGLGIDAGLMIRTPTWRLGVVARDLTTTYNAWSFNFTDKEKEILYLTNNDIPVKSTELTQPRLILGGGYNFIFNSKFSLLAETNLDVTFDGQRNTLISGKPISIDPHLGVEANIVDKVFVRAGISNFQRGLADADTTNQKHVWIFQPSLGAGFKLGNVVIDYAFTNLANQSNPLYTHIFSLRVDLEPKRRY